jgi:hypothetical protein
MRKAFLISMGAISVGVSVFSSYERLAALDMRASCLGVCVSGVTDWDCWGELVVVVGGEVKWTVAVCCLGAEGPGVPAGEICA